MSDKSFVSYAREDDDFVLQLAGDLKARGVPIWLDQWDIQPGAKWHKEIEQALRECSHFLIVLSPDSVASGEVDNELQFALSRGKQIIPVVYRSCERPFRIHSLQYVDFSHGSYETSLSQLLQLFDSPESASAHPGPQVPPLSETRPLPAPELEQQERTLSWTAIPGSMGYVLERDRDASFSKSSIAYQGGDTHIALPRYLSLWSNIYLRVKAKGETEDLDSPWSNVIHL